MDNVSPILVPIFGIIFLFGGPVAIFIVWRVFAHQERMEMIRRGVAPPPGGFNYRDAQRSGGWPPPPGASCGDANVPPPYYGYGAGPMYYAQRRLRRGITVTLVGLALLIGMGFFSPGHVGGPSLAGFIVLFVGIAQIINALVLGARLPFLGPSGGQPGPTPHFRDTSNFGPPPPQPPTPPSGPYGWRPGPTPEIPKPASPPDQR